MCILLLLCASSEALVTFSHSHNLSTTSWMRRTFHSRNKMYGLLIDNRSWYLDSGLVSCVFPLTAKEQDKPITVVYVPSHLYHMVFELFKVVVYFLFHNMSADPHPMITALNRHLAERHARHHGAARRRPALPPHPCAGGAGERGPDGEGEARSPGSDTLVRAMLFA